LLLELAVNRNATVEDFESRRFAWIRCARVGNLITHSRSFNNPWYGLKEKTVTISFRISESAFKALQNDAKKNNTSLNTLANQLFMAYADYDRFLQKFRMVKLSSPTFKRILNAATKEAIVEAGRSAGSSVPESFIRARMGEINTASAVEYLRLMGAYANLFDYSEVTASGKSSVTLTHDLGENGSLFLASYMDALFKSAGKDVKVAQYENGITIDL